MRTLVVNKYCLIQFPRPFRKKKPVWTDEGFPQVKKDKNYGDYGGKCRNKDRYKTLITDREKKHQWDKEK